MFFQNHRDELTARAARKVASAGGDRFHNYAQNSKFANTFLAPVIANRVPYLITPYLGLRARLSQIWINRWTILLILCLVRTLIAIATLHDDILSARKEALSACTGVESMGSAMASMPHYMSQGLNELTAQGIDHAVSGLMDMLTMTVTGVEEIVVFYINMLTSTYLCLFMMVVRGSLHAAVQVIEGVTDFLNSSLKTIGNDIHSTVDGFQSTINDIIGTLNDLDPFGNHDIPKLDIEGDLNKLYNLKIPPGIDKDLEALQKKMPTFEQVQNFADNAIRWPFEEIKDQINKALPNYHFDSSLFPVPPKEHLSFCSDNNGINDFFNGLIDLELTAKKIAISVIVILAVLVCAPMAYSEIRRHRKMQERANLINDPSIDNMDVVYLASRPTTSSVGMTFANTFKATRKQHLVRWAVAYATTVPALFVLSLGVAGLFSCLCRYLILQAVQKEVPALAHEITDFADHVVKILDDASFQWAHDTNNAIAHINTKVNNDVFGWVNISTHALNHTLNVFVDESIGVIKEAFGGTPLYAPIKELFHCLIGIKINNIEKGLTWAHEHAHITFPKIPNNTFSIGASDSIKGGGGSDSFLSTPGGGATDAITGAVDTIVNKMERSIRTEAIISSCVVGIWAIVALLGVVRAVMLFWGKGHMPEGRFGSKVPSSPSLEGVGQTPSVPASATVSEKSHGYTIVEPPNMANNGVGNTYKGQQYTLDPRPPPLFSANGSAAPIRHLTPIQEDESYGYGYAGERNVKGATTRSLNHRKSEQGNLDGLYQAGEKKQNRWSGAKGSAKKNDYITFRSMGH